MLEGRSRLLYIYGPPAAGKLTVAELVAAQTGAKLFHNHLTVNALAPIFGFGSPAYNEILHRFRLDVFRSAATAGVHLIFTNNSAWGGPDGRQRFEQFAAQAAEVVNNADGLPAFVQLTAPPDVLERRLLEPSRQALQKLGDAARLHELLDCFDPTPLHPSDLVVDTSRHSPVEAAAAITAHIEASE